MPLDAPPPLDADLRAALAQATGPIETARGLPSPLYTDAALHAFELKAVFADGWAGAAFAHDVPEIGDAAPFDHAGAPLLLLRDRAGAVRVFQNVCRHRGMILVDAPRRIEGAIRCPYHSWCYGLDGRLVTTPHVGGVGQNLHPAVDRETLGLIEVPSAVWLGVVFVNLSGAARPFDEATAALRARWAAFDRPLHFGGPESGFDLMVETNWKLAVENYCESYHLPWVHPELNAYSRLEDHLNIVEPDAYFGQGVTRYSPSLDAEGRAFPEFAGLPERFESGAEYLVAPPNVLLGVHRDHVFAMLLTPQGPARTRERVAIFYTEPPSADLEGLRRANAALWATVFGEDVFVVEGMQRGRAAPGFDGGRFSPVMDTSTAAFHAWVSRRLLGEGDAL